MKKIFLFILTLLLLLSCNQTRMPPTSEQLESLGFRAVSNAPMVPDIQFADMNGQVHSLSAYQGSVLLLNFWASWCPPCRAEIPDLSSLVRRLDAHEFIMLAINAGENKIRVSKFVEEYEVDFPVFLDEASKASEQIGISNLPTSLLLNRKGELIAVANTALDWDSQAMIDMFLRWSENE